jgi:hypothetical protein
MSRTNKFIAKAALRPFGWAQSGCLFLRHASSSVCVVAIVVPWWVEAVRSTNRPTAQCWLPPVEKSVSINWGKNEFKNIFRYFLTC